MPIHAPFGVFFGHISPQMMSLIVLTPKGLFLGWTTSFEPQTAKIGRAVRTVRWSEKKGQGRTGNKSQKGYISRICGEASTDLVGDVLHVITCTKFQNKIFSGYDFTGGRIFHFPIDFWMGLTTVQRYCAACVKELTYHKIQGVLISHIIYILGRDKSNLAILVNTE